MGWVTHAESGTLLLIMWDATKTSRKPTLTGWVVLLMPYVVTSSKQKEIVYIFKRRLGFIDSNFISYFIHTFSKRPLTNSYLLVQFICMAGTSQSCNHVREWWPITFVMLTRFCLLTKTGFVCFFVDVSQVLYSNIILRCCLWYHIWCEHLYNCQRRTIMNYVSKEYEIKIKMVHEQWLLQKMLF